MQWINSKDFYNFYQTWWKNSWKLWISIGSWKKQREISALQLFKDESQRKSEITQEEIIRLNELNQNLLQKISNLTTELEKKESENDEIAKNYKEKLDRDEKELSSLTKQLAKCKMEIESLEEKNGVFYSGSQFKKEGPDRN